MEGWLEVIARNLTLIVDAMALLIIAVGTIEAFFSGGLGAAHPVGDERGTTGGLGALCALADRRSHLPAGGRHHSDLRRPQTGIVLGDSVQSPSSGLSSTSSLSVTLPRLV
jgi:hypothetical protein